MSNLNNIGNLMHLYMDEIEPGYPTDASDFLIQATATTLSATDGRNWIPVIVREIGEDRYQAIGNAFVYAVAEEAGLERVWCIIADDDDKTAESAKILARESLPKINLSSATRDEIKNALQYLIEQPGSPLKSVKLSIALNKLEAAPRQYWKTFDPISKLKCGITKGKKLKMLEDVFYLTPQPMPEKAQESDDLDLESLTVTELKKIAKERGCSGYSKKKKTELIELLSQ